MTPIHFYQRAPIINALLSVLIVSWLCISPILAAIPFDMDGDSDADANDGVMFQRRVTGAGTLTTNIALPTNAGGIAASGARANNEVVLAADAARTVADIDGDGDSDANDGVMIQRRLTGAGSVSANIALPVATEIAGEGPGGTLSEQQLIARIDALRLDLPGYRQTLESLIHDQTPVPDYDGKSAFILFRQNFDHRAIGPYDADDLCEDIPDAASSCRLVGGGQIVAVDGEPGNRELAITLHEGTYASNAGAKTYMRIPNDGSEEHTELYLSYRLRFASGFDWGSTGGKLPGFGGYATGVTEAQHATSSTRLIEVDKGFTARLMFRQEGGSETYIHHQDQIENPGAGDHDTWWFQSQPFQFKTQTSYLIEQRVKINTPKSTDSDAQDGIIEIWVNGIQVYKRSNLTLSESGNYGINRVYLDIWHGGGTPQFAPSKDTELYIDDVAISTVPLTH